MMLVAAMLAQPWVWGCAQGDSPSVLPWINSSDHSGRDVGFIPLRPHGVKELNRPELSQIFSVPPRVGLKESAFPQSLHGDDGLPQTGRIDRSVLTCKLII
jgi:hypothetical protein